LDARNTIEPFTELSTRVSSEAPAEGNDALHPGPKIPPAPVLAPTGCNVVNVRPTPNDPIPASVLEAPKSPENNDTVPGPTDAVGADPAKTP
jgi:hypothetical protein